MKLDNYLNKKFPDLKLKLGLFYEYPIGIRFELGCEEQFKDNDVNYRSEVYKKSITIFRDLFDVDDEIFIVTNVHTEIEKEAPGKLKVYSNYIKNKKTLYSLNTMKKPNVDEDDYLNTHQFWLKCKVSDVDYVGLIKAVCNQDLGIKPFISHDVFFVNITKQLIFNVYDDRGCDVVATSLNVLENVYHLHEDWILSYDKKEIDKRFKNIDY
ncbi:DUF3885 domain-containing protein [Viridibacillus sp. NPDC093762]|uniref:DUF3885 domain-containing protein n=1 Tax=Viridibacillus sp. NPDC093762 TaxID=3390720 RepID=UPI003D01F73E